MKKKIVAVLLVLVLVFTTCGCTESLKRGITDAKSNWTGGLERVVRVYTADGKIIAEYEGKIDLESTDGYVKFDLDGKRYIYYNCFVETIAEI